MGIPSQIKLSAKPALVKDGGSHARLLASGYQLHQLRQPIAHTSAARTGSLFDCLHHDRSHRCICAMLWNQHM